MDKGKSKDGKDGKESMERSTQTWALSSPYIDEAAQLRAIEAAVIPGNLVQARNVWRLGDLSLASANNDDLTMLAVTLANLELARQEGMGDAAAGKGKGQGQGRGHMYQSQPYILDKGMIKGKGKGMIKGKGKGMDIVHDHALVQLDMDDYDFGKGMDKDKAKGMGKDEGKGKDKDKGEGEGKGGWPPLGDGLYLYDSGWPPVGDDYMVWARTMEDYDDSSNEYDFDPMIIAGSGKGKGK